MDPVAAAASGVAFLAYYNTLKADFVYDDARAILQNEDLLSSSPLSNLLTNDFWGTPLSHSGSHKSYRPLCTLTFKLNHITTGSNPYYFHLVNVVLHAIVTYLFVIWARKVLHSRLGVAFASLLFSLHPIHTEAVAGIVGRADMLAAAFFLLALISYHNHMQARGKGKLLCSGGGGSDRNGNVMMLTTKSMKATNVKGQQRPSYLASTVICAALAMLSKEQGVTVLGVCFIIDLLTGRGQHQKWRMKARSLFSLAASTVVLLVIRGRLMGYSAPKFAKADNPASGSDSLLTRTLTYFYLPAFNFWLLVCPSKLAFDWSMDAVPLISSVFDQRNLVTLIFYSVLAIGGLAILRSNRNSGTSKKILLWSGSIMALSFLPATNLLFYVGFVVAERILYVPSIGFCLLTGYAAARLSRRLATSRKMTVICGLAFAILSLSFAIKTFSRNNDWKDEESLYRSGLAINPAKALGNLGNVLTQKGRLTEAETAFKKAIARRPNMADAHYNLGVLFQRQNRLEEALQSYKNAIHFRPKLVLAHLNLGLTYSAMGQKRAALEILEAVEVIDDDGLKDPKTHATTQVSALFHTGKLMLEVGRASEAVDALQKAANRGRTIHYALQGILNVLGEAYQALNKTREAERSFRAALQAKPDHIPAYLTYGKLLAKNKARHSEAEAWFSKANITAPEDPSVHLHYGLFLMDLDRNLEAAREFAKAAELKPDDFESIFNAGVAYRQAGDNVKAEIFYRKSVDLRPQDASAHMNLGAMLHLVGKLVEAETHYFEALRLRPEDAATTSINIQRLHRVMKSKGLPIRAVPN